MRKRTPRAEGNYGPAFAGIYSGSWGKRFAERNGPALLALLRRHAGHRRPLRVLDVACGSGEFAALLSGHGHLVRGVDGSRSMVSLARKRAPAGTFGVWRFGDSSNELHGPFDAAFCLYDSLNYCRSLGIVRRTLGVVKRNLVSGGVLFFDVNTAVGHQRRWRGSFAVENASGFCFCRLDAWNGSPSAQADLVGFARRRRAWIRFEECHIQIPLDDAAISRALRAARFTAFRRFSPKASGLQVDAGRRWWIARA